VAERIREAVLNLGIENNGSGYNRCVLVSIGVATVFPGSGASSDTLIALADRALYQSKVGGRNRTTLAEELVQEVF
jgi:diguanylate cyclase (GGDEF)-like protein